MFLISYNIQLDKIIIILTDQNCRPIEIEDKVNKIVKTKPVEEIIISPGKREKSIEWIKTSIIKMEHY